LVKICNKCNKKIILGLAKKYENKYYHNKCADEQKREDIINKKSEENKNKIITIKDDITEKAAWGIINKYVDKYENKWDCIEKLIIELNKKYGIFATKLSLLNIVNEMYENKKLTNLNIDRLEKEIKSKNMWDIIRNYVEKYDDPINEFTNLFDLLTIKYNIDVSKKDLSHLLFKLFNKKEEKNKLNRYNELKKILISEHPESIEDYIDAFLKHFDEYDRKFLNLFKKLLEEKEFNTDDLNSLIQKRKKYKKINGFENQLYKKDNHGLINIEEMSASEFENFLIDLFILMEYNVDKNKIKNEKGADFIIEKIGEKTIVQAKSFLDFVKEKDVQDVLKAKEYYYCDNAMIIASSFFTKNAMELAIKHNIKTWDSKKIKEMIDKYRISTSEDNKKYDKNEKTFRI
jgi:HJR/Mrr/RecB family endonuclease